MTHNQIAQLASDEIKKVLKHGAKKHGDSWIDRDDIEDIDHLMAHVVEHFKGNLRDKASGELNISHALTRCALILARYKQRRNE